MTYTVNIIAPRLGRVAETSSMLAIVAQDGVAQPSTTFTIAASAVTATTADNTGFFPTDYIELPGGTAAALTSYQIQTCGVPSGSDNTTRVDIRNLRTPITTVTAVAASPYYKVPCRFMPQSVRLVNLTTGVVYEWCRGMLNNRAIQNPGGAATLLTTSGIIATPNFVHFHPSLLGLSESMRVEIQYANS